MQGWTLQFGALAPPDDQHLSLDVGQSKGVGSSQTVMLFLPFWHLPWVLGRIDPIHVEG